MFFSNKNKKQSKKKSGGKSPFVTKLGEIKHNKLEDPAYKAEWTENSFLSNIGEREMVGKTFDYSRLRLIAAGLFLLLMVLVLRVGWLQVAQGEYYNRMAEGNRIRIKEIEPKRGVIYDRDYNPLVRNVANFILYLIPADLPSNKEERNQIIEKVVKLSYGEDSVGQNELSVSGIKEKISQRENKWFQSYSPLFIADNIPYKKAITLYLKSQDWGGVVLTNKTRRQYLLSTDMKTVDDTTTEEEGEDKVKEVTVKSLSHILGYTGKISQSELAKHGEEYSLLDYTGKLGIEHFWEEELKGEKGRKKAEVDALGKEKREMSRIEPRDGNNLILSLDLGLQAKIETILKEHLNSLHVPGAVAVVTNPNTGEILSLVSIPSYDNNKFARGITNKEYEQLTSETNDPLFNRAISGEYPPGSTFKLIVGAAALEEGIITEKTSFKSTGGIRINKWFFPDWKAGGHGITDIRKAISQSVNTFFYYIGGGYNEFNGLGVDKITDYAKKFGLGEKTGIDLTSEADGFLPRRKWKKEKYGEPWYIGNTYHLAIGQGFLLVTPLQLADYTSVFANSGILYRPHLVKKIQDSSGETVREIRPDVMNQNFIDDYNIKLIRQGMKQAVTSGSCVRLSSLDVRVAGKTGTAQWSSKKEPHAWFTGFAPYDDPEITLTILVEQGGGSAEVVVPIAKDIFKYYFDKKAKILVE